MLVADFATGVAVGSDGVVWVASSGPGGVSLDRRSGDDWTTVTNDDSLPFGLVGTSLLLLGVDTGGDVWVTYDAFGYPSGPWSLFEFDGEVWTDHSDAAMAGTNSGSMACCFVDMGVDGTVVAGGHDSHSRFYDGTAWTDAADPDATRVVHWRKFDWTIVRLERDEVTVVDFESPMSGSPAQVVEGHDGSIWVRLRQRNVWVRDVGGSAVAYEDGDRGVNNSSCSILGAVAPDGALWYVTPCEQLPLEERSESTLVRLDPGDETITEVTAADGLPAVILDFGVGPDGTVWVAGEGGVVRITLDTVGGQGRASDGGSPHLAGSMTPAEVVPPLSVPPVDFGELAGRRYVAEVFSDIEKVAGIVYWPSGAGEPLSLDISMPVGDTASRRPVIVTGEGELPEWVRRGYVVVTVYPRTWMSAGESADTIIESLQRDTVRWAAAVRWLRANAEEYRLHPEAIAATGFSYQGAVSLALGWGQQNEVTDVRWPGFFWSDTPPATVSYQAIDDLGDVHPEQSSNVAAVAAVIPWFFPELVDRGESAVIIHAGTHDQVFEIAETAAICPAAHAVDVSCEFHEYSAGHDSNLGLLGVDRTALFLYDNMIEPLGLAEDS